MIVGGRIRSPSSGTANSVAITAKSGDTNPVIVGPVIDTAMSTPTMNRIPPSRERLASRQTADVMLPRAGDGSTPATARAITLTSARVQARPAMASGENERSATAVAG